MIFNMTPEGCEKLEFRQMEMGGELGKIGVCKKK